MADLLEAGCAIHAGRLIHTGIKAGNSGDVGHRTEAAALPDTQDDKDQRPDARLIVEVDAGHSKGSERLIDQAIGTNKSLQHQRDHRPRHKVGQNGDGLRHPLEAFVLEFREHNGQNNRDDGCTGNEEDIQVNRVEEYAANSVVGKEKFEVLEANKRTSHNSQRVIIILEGKGDALQRDIAEHDKPDDSGQHHQVQMLIRHQLRDYGKQAHFGQTSPSLSSTLLRYNLPNFQTGK